MWFQCQGRSGAGVLRTSNQDNLYINGQILAADVDSEVVSLSDTAAQGIYAVCDGMGGEHFGEEASLIGVRGLDKLTPDNFSNNICSYLLSVNAELCDLMCKRDNLRIGTTFVALCVTEDAGCMVNIGDSRCYHFRSGRFVQLSRDHTQVQRLINMGFISRNDAAKHPDRHKLTQHLGIFPEEMIIEPYLSEKISVQNGDVFLLCSDGLTEMVSEDEIQMILSTQISLKDKADKLYELAMRHGGKDNITVILVETENDCALTEGG